MKFGAKLETFIVPQWAEKYVRYKYLQRLLKQAAHIPSAAHDSLDDEERELESRLFTTTPGSDVRAIRLPSDSRTDSENDATISLDETVPTSVATRKSTKCLFLRSTRSEPESDVECLNPDIVKEVADHFERYGHLTLETLLQNSPLMRRKIKASGPSGGVDDVLDKIPEESSVAGGSTLGAAGGTREGAASAKGVGAAVGGTRTVAGVAEDEESEDLEDLEDLGDSGDEGEGNECFDSDVNGDSLRGSGAERLIESSSTSIEESNLRPEPVRSSGDVQSGKSALGGEDVEGAEHFRADDADQEGTSPQPGATTGAPGHTPRNLVHFKSRLGLGWVRLFSRSAHLEAVPMFDKCLRADIRKVMLHYLIELDYVRILLKCLKTDLKRRGDNVDANDVSLFQKACTALWDISDKLNMYLNVNTLAVYKILKKKDKLLGTSDVKDIYGGYKNALLGLDVSQTINAEIMDLYQKVSKAKIIDFSNLKKQVEHTLDTQVKVPPMFLHFLQGCCTIVFLNCLFLSFYSFNKKWDLKLIVYHFPMYRFFFVCSLIWWGFGFCQGYFEAYGVNYQFLFGMSTNYSVTDLDFYYFGAVEMLLCLSLFMTFLLDVKLSIFRPHQRFYWYPLALILSSLGFLFLPHKSFKLKIRKRLVYLFLRVLVTPIGLSGKVTLAASILGDVLCSLTRPLMDFVYIVHGCSVGFAGNDLPRNVLVHKYIVPMIISLPYFLRFSQCLKRFIGERSMLHVGNMGKYISCILCVIVAAVNWVWCCRLTVVQSRALVFTTYAVATIYNCLWDFTVDWGLSLNWDIFKARGGRRFYSKKAYYVACVINLLCRCTWAITTMPVVIIEDHNVVSDSISLAVSVIEIFRRIVWVIFRLECEHLLNSYNYRTALWVPKLYSCKNLIVQELKFLNPSN